MKTDSIDYENGTIAVGKGKKCLNVRFPDILYIESEINYSRFHLADGTEPLSAYTLKFISSRLISEHFIRCHRKYIINKNHVKDHYPKPMSKGYTYIVEMSNGNHIECSCDHKTSVKNELKDKIVNK